MALKDVVVWRDRIRTSIAASRAIRGGNYVQLATCDASGSPRVRTVVFRGFSPRGDLKITTDARSAKVEQSKDCELCWWFSQSNEQYRIRGTLEYVKEGELRREAWDAMSKRGRAQFFAPRTPDFREGQIEQEEKIPDSFLLVLLKPSACDYLNLDDNYRQLDREREDGEWISERIHP